MWHGSWLILTPSNKPVLNEEYHFDSISYEEDKTLLRQPFTLATSMYHLTLHLLKELSCWIFTGEGEEENDEKNLAYVAITRAKKGLEISDTIRKVIDFSVSQIIAHASILRVLFVLATFKLNEGLVVGKLKQFKDSRELQWPENKWFRL